jgi:energy-coupling factor transporter ATP-binding protein EcfA2
MRADAAQPEDFGSNRSDGSVRIGFRKRAKQRSMNEAPFHVSRARDGCVWTEFYRLGRDYLLRFPDLADFIVSADGREASCALAPAASMEQVEHLWLNQVAPLARSKQGATVFHGSCVEIGGRAIAFIGESGSGKSTLAACFASLGHAFMADDGLIVRPFGVSYLAAPSHSSIRLWPDSCEALSLKDAGAESKSAIRARDGFEHCGAPRPLAVVYFLGKENETVAFTTLSARESTLLLLQSSFLLDVEDRELIATHFQRTVDFANRVTCVRLEFPRRFGELSRVTAAIVEDMGSRAPAI